MDNLEKSQKDLLKALKKYQKTLEKFADVAIRTIGSSFKAREKILKELQEIGKFVEDIEYYEKHGSKTLPKNQRISLDN